MTVEDRVKDQEGKYRICVKPIFYGRFARRLPAKAARHTGYRPKGGKKQDGKRMFSPDKTHSGRKRPGNTIVMSPVLEPVPCGLFVFVEMVVDLARERRTDAIDCFEVRQPRIGNPTGRAEMV